jgi:outer membrane biosynthesis protein TonB
VTDRGAKHIAIVVTLLVHVGVGVSVALATQATQGRLSERANLADEKREHIQAGLAIKSKSAKGRKTKQPQRETERKVSPTDVAVSRDEKPVDPKDKKEKDPLDEVAPESVFDKHRQGATGPAEPTSAAPGGDDETKVGRDDGSDWGTQADTVGDPYVGELNGRLHEHWEVPSTVTDTALEAAACVRLSPDGKIADFRIEKSGNATFDAAVERAVKQASDMEAPVPDHLSGGLTKEGLCFAFKP